MTLIGIRITADNDTNLKHFAQNHVGLWCKEGGDLEKYCAKPHYHGLVETTMTTNGLRKQIYNTFEVPQDKRGQQFCAFSKITDEEGFQRYLCKGTEKTYPLILQNNFEIDINERYDQYWDVYQGLKKDAKEKREKKKTNKACFKDYFIANFVPIHPNAGFAKKDENGNLPLGKCRLNKRKIAMIMYVFYEEREWELPSPSQGEITIMDLYLRYAQTRNIKNEICEYWRIYEYDGPAAH